MEEKRVPKEVAQIVAKWWADKICGNVKFDNGDPSETGLLCMGLASMCVKEVTEEQRQKFIDTLSGMLEEKDYIYLGVDYAPGRLLREAAEQCGISENNFPWKTSTVSQRDFKAEGDVYLVYASHGYRAEPQVIATWSN